MENIVVDGVEVSNNVTVSPSCSAKQEKQRQLVGEEEKSLLAKKKEVEDEELRKLLLSDIEDLPLSPPSIVESNFARYFAPDFMKPEHDQYIYRHANGMRNTSNQIQLCAKYLVARIPTLFSGFNRCCVKGSLLEVHNRLIANPELVDKSADRDGFIAIIMPRPVDWMKVKGSLMEFEEYGKLRKIS